MAAQPSAIERELSLGSELSIIKLVDTLLAEAKLMRASDIHISPKHDKVLARLRIDGVLQDICALPKTIHHEVISRIKVLSALRTDEHQVAQDGRFRVVIDDAPIDVRVSIAPTYFGENAVLRILADKMQDYSLADLGFSPSDEKKILKAIRKPYGMILSTGPTGSGKTTTLYTLIKMLASNEVSVVTIEDPIEYTMEDITQIQINSRSGLTFANGLRSILRQDPNIIMVGEIRDAETATIAVNTALTGHLLLSTLHTNDAATTLPRLLDMGIDPYLVASTANIAIGQRLVRKICEKCKVPYELTENEREALGESFMDEVKFNNGQFCVGSGCEACNNTGYKGRVGINEVLVVDEAVREAILRKAPASALRAIAIANGMTTMFVDGARKAALGHTTLAEVLRTINE